MLEPIVDKLVPVLSGTPKVLIYLYFFNALPKYVIPAAVSSRPLITFPVNAIVLQAFEVLEAAYTEEAMIFCSVFFFSMNFSSSFSLVSLYNKSPSVS